MLLTMTASGRRKSLSVEFKSSTNMTITPKYNNVGVELQYSINNGIDWTVIANGVSTPSAKSILMRGIATGTKSLYNSVATNNKWIFGGATNLEVIGDLCTLLLDSYDDPSAPKILGDYAFCSMFYQNSDLIYVSDLLATGIGGSSYRSMFELCTSLVQPAKMELNSVSGSLACAYMYSGCSNISIPPYIYVSNMTDRCFYGMFRYLTLLKVSETQTSIYQYPWRFPAVGTGISAYEWSAGMLSGTGGTFTSNPSINTTYYTDHEPI